MDVTVIWQKFVEGLLESEAPLTKAWPDLTVEVERARQEWLKAQNYYNNVCDQDLVDHAVFSMQAAEKKYIYLLKQARQNGVTYSPYLAGMEINISSNSKLD